MTNTREVWLIVADAKGARLLHGTPTQHEHLHLDEVASLATRFRTGEHQRPTRLSRPGRSAPIGHEFDLKTTQSAAELAPWVEKELRSRGIARCALFAPSHLIGAMRKSAGKGMADILTEHEGELAQLSNGALAKHPRIVELLPA